MDTHTLTAFLAVADTQSFSQAAEQLFITQSAVSKRIALLEEQLNQRLFDRIGRKVSLTEAGDALLPRAKNILNEIKDATRAMGNLSGEVSGILSLAASHHISLHRLPPILRAFTRRYPQVTLDLRFHESEIAYNGVQHGDLELALITLSPHPDPMICSYPIWEDRLQYVVAKDHPLAKKPQVSLSELTGHAAILPSESTFTHQIVADQFQRNDLALNVMMSTNYLDTIRMMVSIGLGWSLLPETMIDESLTILHPSAEPIVRELGYIYHRDRTLSNAASALVSMLTNTE
ncbi:LysR family transcriptional regulator [Neptunomonas phycophila]|jgi:DNA-binding transcriptional LysR family regulator|uniref:LysR family transcriptional regulator n=1 Tax=Neptunomonas TaxID=75687 RepID=UPI000948B093|nr:LysR family transcriptional regulator [Neptunomonas phycophila]QLE97686.1 LysR family transcriptional regulator [Neptunomonas phycophila]